MRDEKATSDVPERYALPVLGTHRSRPALDQIRREFNVTAPAFSETARRASDRRLAGAKELAKSRARLGAAERACVEQRGRSRWLQEGVPRAPGKRPQVEE
jgi:hypothetical protein